MGSNIDRDITREQLATRRRADGSGILGEPFASECELAHTPIKLRGFRHTRGESCLNTLVSLHAPLPAALMTRSVAATTCASNRSKARTPA